MVGYGWSLAKLPTFVDKARLVRGIEARLKQLQLTGAAASLRAVGNKSLISNLKRDKSGFPTVENLERLCEVLGWEFYVGERRSASGSATTPTETQIVPMAPPAPAHEDQRVRRVQEALLMMSRALDELMPVETWGGADDDGLHTIGDGWFRAWMARHGAIPEQCGMTGVDSDDMEPTLPPGSAVVVDRSQARPVESGVFMLRFGKRRAFRRLRRDGPSRWIAYGDNPLCEDSEPMRRPRLVGKVLWSACDLRDDNGPFARTPRAIYALFARQVGRPALMEAARDVPLEALEAFALDQALRAESHYKELLSG